MSSMDLSAISMRGLSYQSGLDAIRLAARTAQHGLLIYMSGESKVQAAYAGACGLIGASEDRDMLWG
ncbi:hypothetical protein, partial [Gluconacetobacter sp.]|uniref:hypothetical protein n=1 Tax=Gluconacetobacter sp. TaxID=1935994 RepID=UPI0039E881A5